MSDFVNVGMRHEPPAGVWFAGAHYSVEWGQELNPGERNRVTPGVVGLAALPQTESRHACSLLAPLFADLRVLSICARNVVALAAAAPVLARPSAMKLFPEETLLLVRTPNAGELFDRLRETSTGTDGPRSAACAVRRAALRQRGRSVHRRRWPSGWACRGRNCRTCRGRKWRLRSSRGAITCRRSCCWSIRAKTPSVARAVARFGARADQGGWRRDDHRDDRGRGGDGRPRGRQSRSHGRPVREGAHDRRRDRSRT